MRVVLAKLNSSAENNLHFESSEYQQKENLCGYLEPIRYTKFIFEVIMLLP